MSSYTYETAIDAMNANSAIEAIVYKIEENSHTNETISWSVERRSDYLIHKWVVENKTTGETNCVGCQTIQNPLPSLPAPCSPLCRQVATGCPSMFSCLRITLPPSEFSSPASGSLAPIVLLSPLALSRQVSLESVTGVEEKPNTHLFFDENGNTTDGPEFYLELPSQAPMRHPRVLLAYLRYVSLQNEVASSSEQVPWPLLTEANRKYVHRFIYRTSPPPEFQSEIDDLFTLMDNCPTE